VVEREGAADGLCLRVVIFGGETLEVQSLRPWFERYGDKSPQLINMYGITETTVHVTYRPISISDLENTARSPIGVPIPDLQVYVLDRRMEPVPVGVAGEMYVGGAGLARNYLNRPELTAQRFVADPFDTQGGGRLYRTGDLARFLPGGELDYLGRIDQQVKVRGFRIELGEIEAALQEQAGVSEAVVMAQAETGGEGQRIVAYIVATTTGQQDASGVMQEPERAQLDVGMLRRELEQRLPQYMLPSMFVMMDELPLTPNGKIDRKALPVAERAAMVAGTEYVAPRDLLELDVARIWEDVLGVNSVGVKSNFFELGGHSLLAVRLFAQIEQKFGVKLPLASLFRSPTVEQLTDQLRQRSNGVTGSNLVEIRPGNSAPPVFFVHPIGGNVLCYAELARHLDLAQPFLGLQAEGLDGEREPLRSIESMAAHYIKLLRDVQPAGPYLLGGWSMGGVIAYEMAQQLLRQGQQIALLAMLDSYAPATEDAATLEDEDEETLLARFALDVGLAPDSISRSHAKMAGLAPYERLAVVLEQAKSAGFVHRDVSLSRVHGLYSIFKINNRALKRYTPLAYAGNVVLFKATEEARSIHSDSTSGWGSLVTGGLDISEVAGDHYSMIRAPHVSVLADQLKSYLNKTNRA
jgi:thioesterase domain-containing protein/acyl carrier protein